MFMEIKPIYLEKDLGTLIAMFVATKTNILSKATMFS